MKRVLDDKSKCHQKVLVAVPEAFEIFLPNKKCKEHINFIT